MNTLKKIGLTALGTSLVAGSAYAGEITASGDAGYTWSSEEVGVRTDEGYGFNHDITFSGSGELDNGFTVSTTMILTESSALSSSNVALTMGGLGTITIGNGLANIGGAYDDVTPRAYEENSDGMKTVGALDSVGTLMDGNAILYASPSFDIGGGSASFKFAYSPENGDAATGEGGVAAQSSTYDSGMGLGVDVTYGGLSVGAFADEVKAAQGSASNHRYQRDAMSATWYANYSMGPVSIGYQTGGLDRGLATAATAATTAKTVAAAGGNFEFEKMSIAFNVNENLSISYGSLTETYDAQGVASIADVDLESDSIQFAYTMGSMSIKGYQTDESNPGWDNDAEGNEVTELAVNFAF
ncbi:porin [Candidatus Pelagibacter sp.]|nr:porin [Candidatus Pelagibacter sp.]